MQQVIVRTVKAACKWTFATFTICKNHYCMGSAGKKAAAIAAVNEYITQDGVIGIGSGSTIVYAVQHLAKVCEEKGLNIQCIPTSYQLNVAIDGADEVDAELVAIKGGGGCLTQEKIIASCASKFILIADNGKMSQNLGTKWKKGVPLEVIPMATVPVMRKIEKELGGQATLRMANTKMGPTVTDNGNFLIDWKFNEGQMRNWTEVNAKLKDIPGIVETGLFVNMACKAFFGNEHGEVTVINSST